MAGQIIGGMLALVGLVLAAAAISATLDRRASTARIRFLLGPPPVRRLRGCGVCLAGRGVQVPPDAVLERLCRAHRREWSEYVSSELRRREHRRPWPEQAGRAGGGPR